MSTDINNEELLERIAALKSDPVTAHGFEASRRSGWNAALWHVEQLVLKAAPASSASTMQPVGYTSQANLNAMSKSDANAIPLYREKIKEDMVRIYVPQSRAAEIGKAKEDK